ncbi:MAG: MotA/TolQ/ExbB proton channel family protein [Phycisphaerales bacterium]
MTATRLQSEHGTLRWRPLVRGVAAGFFLAMLVACGAIAQISIGTLIDAPVALFVIAATLAIAVSAVGPGSTRRAIFGGSTATGDTDRSIRTTIAAFALLSGFVGTTIGFVGVLANLDTPAALGSAASSCLLSSFYGAVLAMLMLARAGVRTPSNEISSRSPDDSTVIFLVTVAVTFAATLLNLVAFLAIWLAIS